MPKIRPSLTALALLLTAAAHAAPPASQPAGDLFPNTRWQHLSPLLRHVTVGPDARIWFEFRSAKPLDDSDFKQLIETQFKKPNPRIQSAYLLLIEPNGRAWFTRDAKTLLAYDGKTWLEHDLRAGDQLYIPRVSTGSVPRRPPALAIAGHVLFATRYGLDTFDGAKWTFHKTTPDPYLFQPPQISPMPDDKSAVILDAKSVWHWKPDSLTKLPIDIDRRNPVRVIYPGIYQKQPGVWTLTDSLVIHPFDAQPPEKSALHEKDFSTVGDYTLVTPGPAWALPDGGLAVAASEILTSDQPRPAAKPRPIRTSEPRSIHKLLVLNPDGTTKIFPLSADLAAHLDEVRYFPLAQFIAPRCAWINNFPNAAPFLFDFSTAKIVDTPPDGRPVPYVFPTETRIFLLASPLESRINSPHVPGRLGDGNRRGDSVNYHGNTLYTPNAPLADNVLIAKRLEDATNLKPRDLRDEPAIDASGTMWLSSPVRHFDGIRWVNHDIDIQDLYFNAVYAEKSGILATGREGAYLFSDELNLSAQNVKDLIAANKKHFLQTFTTRKDLSAFGFSSASDADENIWTTDARNLDVLVGKEWKSGALALSALGYKNLTILGSAGKPKKIVLLDHRKDQLALGQIVDGEIVVSPIPNLPKLPPKHSWSTKIFPAPDGGFWIGLYSDHAANPTLALHITDGVITEKLDTLGSPQFIDAAGRLWLARADGYSLILTVWKDAKPITTITLEDAPASFQFTSDPAGSLWIWNGSMLTQIAEAPAGSAKPFAIRRHPVIGMGPGPRLVAWTKQGFLFRSNGLAHNTAFHLLTVPDAQASAPPGEPTK